MIPYSTEVFLAVLAEYNEAQWPLQVLAFLLGVLVLVLVARPSDFSAKITGGILAAAWALTGTAYHLRHFTVIDFWAYVFGAAFLVQCLLLLVTCVYANKLQFGAARGAEAWLGGVMAVFGLACYPLTSLLIGRDAVETGYFGTAPAPTVLFTLGVLLCSAPRSPLYLFVIPLAWCGLAGFVAFERDIWEDYALVVTGALVLCLLLAGRKRLKAD